MPYICWLDVIKLGLSFETQIIEINNRNTNNRNGVNKQNTLTSNTQRKITLDRVCKYANKGYPLLYFFKTASPILPTLPPVPPYTERGGSNYALAFSS